MAFVLWSTAPWATDPHCVLPACRFDIVLLLLDQHEPQWDAIVSEHVLANHQQVKQHTESSPVACNKPSQQWSCKLSPTMAKRHCAHSLWACV